MREVRTLYVDTGEDGVRLDRWFKRRWPHLNHIQLQKLTRSGQIRVDGSRAKPDTRLAAGAQVRVPPLPDAPPPRDRNELDHAAARSVGRGPGTSYALTRPYRRQPSVSSHVRGRQLIIGS